MIERDPGLAVEMLQAGDFDEGLEAERKAVFIVSAKTAERLKEEVLVRELAADRRELKRDAEAAIAKLRGGQQVPEATVLESRAEALEDGETLTALRHAEDDQVFMRGFAQRPPAEQAARVTAMENGPELKPIESRRLAAMKAQAAVTGRALATDPLAYAHRSGVIEEPADLTGLAPEALRARLHQAEITEEQFGLATLPLLRPGEAEAFAKEITAGAPEEARSKFELLADLPEKAQARILEQIGSASAPIGRRILQDLADTEPEQALALLANLDPGKVTAMGFDTGAFVAEQRFRGSLDERSILEQARDLLANGQRTFPQIHRGLIKLGIDPAKLGVDVSPEEAEGVRVRLAAEGELIALSAGNSEDLGSLGISRAAAEPEEVQKRRLEQLSGGEGILSNLRPKPDPRVSTIFDTPETERELEDAERRANEEEDPESALPQPRALIDVPPEQIAERQQQVQVGRQRELNALFLDEFLPFRMPEEMRADFERLQEDFFLRTGDFLLSHRLTMQQLDDVWGLAREGPSPRFVRRSEAEGEVQSFSEFIAFRSARQRDQLEAAFQTVDLLAAISTVGGAVLGTAKLGRALFKIVFERKRAERALQSNDLKGLRPATKSKRGKGVSNPEIPKLEAPSLPEGMNRKSFGETFIAWGKGPQGALERLANINAEVVAQMKANGLTKDIAKQWRDFYANDFARNKNNTTARERVRLMEKILELLGD